MIVYGCITNTLDKNKIEDISVKQANKILKEKEIILKSLLRYGNERLKKKDIKPFKHDENNNKEPYIKIISVIR